MLMSSGANFGIKPSLPHFLGICIGFPVMVLALGLGLGSLFEALPIVHQIIKVVGAAYMLFLAWKISQSKAKKKKGHEPKPLTFLQACLFQWTNPKALVMAIGAIATYTTLNGNINLQVLFMAMCLCLYASHAPAYGYSLGAPYNDG